MSRLDRVLAPLFAGAHTNMEPVTLVERPVLGPVAEIAKLPRLAVPLLDLEGCMDPKAKNYRKYFVHSLPKRCTY